MSFFGWKLVKEAPSEKDLKKELAAVKKELAKKERLKANTNLQSAQPHLKAIERYKEQLSLTANELRQAELKAIIAQRVAKVRALGVECGN